MLRAERIGRRIKTRQLEVLIAVAQSGNMAKAAVELAISQPVVSKTIADLERALGIRLFDRDRRGVTPTLYGRALMKRGVAILNDLRASVTELEFLADPTAGELRIGSSEAVASGMLTAIIDRIANQHPRITFEVTLGGGLIDLQYRELQAHAIDLIIGRLPAAIPADVVAEALYHDHSFVVTGASNPLLLRRKFKLSELLDKPWCLPPLDSYPWTLAADAFHNAGLELPRRVVTTRSVALLTTLVATGRYFSILPRTVLNFAPERRSLKVLPLKLPMQPYPVGIVTLKNRTASPVAQLFIDHARQVSKSLYRDKK